MMNLKMKLFFISSFCTALACTNSVYAASLQCESLFTIANKVIPGDARSVTEYIEGLAQLYLDIEFENIPASQREQAVQHFQNDSAKIVKMDPRNMQLIKYKIAELRQSSVEKKQRKEIEKEQRDQVVHNTRYVDPRLLHNISTEEAAGWGKTISPDHLTMALCDYIGSSFYLTLTDISTGKQLRKIPVSSIFVRSVFSKDSKTIAISYQSSFTEVYDVLTGNLLQSFNFLQGTDINLSNDGRSIRGVRHDKGIPILYYQVFSKTLNQKSSQPVDVGRGYKHRLLSPNHNLVLQSNAGLKVTERGSKRIVFSMPTTDVHMSSLFSQDERYLISSFFTSVQIIDLKTKQIIKSIPRNQSAVVKFSIDEKNIILIQEQKIEIYEVATGQLVKEIVKTRSGHFGNPQVSSNGQYLILNHSNIGMVVVYDLILGQQIYEIALRNFDGPAVSPDNKFLVLHDGNRRDDGLHIFLLSTGELLAQLPSTDTYLFSADSQSLVLKFKNEKQVQIYSIYTSAAHGNSSGAKSK